MNNLYFYCSSCGHYVDAGYRFCFHALERPGLVSKGSLVDVDKVQSVKDYWSGGGFSFLAEEILPDVKRFLSVHKTHQIRYGETEDMVNSGALEDLSNWKEI